MIRLLLSGVALLRDCELRSMWARIGERLLAIRDGALPWADLEVWRHELHCELDEAYRTTTLPDRPDYEAVNRFLIKARRSAIT